MRQKRTKKMIPVALAITTASALSAMAFHALPDTGAGHRVEHGPEIPVAFGVATAGRGAAQLNIYENDLNPILGAPVYDRTHRFAGHVAELMVSAEGDVRGMVLAVPGADTGIKRVAAVATEFKVVNPTAGDTMVLAEVTRADLQERPAFAPDYATDFH